jgi:hypothetical protein
LMGCQSTISNGCWRLPMVDIRSPSVHAHDTQNLKPLPASRLAR